MQTAFIIGVLFVLVVATLLSMFDIPLGRRVPFDRSMFKQMSTLLSAQGASIVASEYRSRSFGSWFIDIAATPPLRVSWDGKDQVFFVLKQTEEIHPSFGSNIYEPILKMDQPADEAVALRHAADEVRRASAA